MSNGEVAGRPDESDEAGRALTLPRQTGAAATQPLDATIVGSPEPAPSLPLPHISVSEPAEEDEPQAAGTAGPDLVVVGMLGEGGMGRVQLARQRSLQREVAIKRLRVGASDWDAHLLRAEALVTGHLEHPNIIPVHALGIDSRGRPILVMKRVEGVSWRDLLHDEHHPGWARREPDREARLVWHIDILAQLCNAIAFAHNRGIVHRDMKPDNVMVGEFGEVYLIDWGVAVKSGAHSRDAAGNPVLVGTPAYMAPEMARGGPLDEQTDVYLLGAALHEILTGEVRHRGDDLHAVTEQALASLPFAYGEEVPAELAELANRATSAEPSARPRGALGFRQALLDHVRHRSSLRLSAAADRGLATIEHGAPASAAHGRVLEESRFGYREALREWPVNPDALRGLRRCAIVTVRFEIARRDASAAAAALAELSDPPPELALAVRRLEASLAAEAAERERLRRIAHDVDPTVGAPARIVLFTMLLVVAGSIVAYAIRRHRSGTVGYTEFLLFPAILAVISLAFLFFLRRQLSVNAFNRRLAAWFASLILILLANRVLGRVSDMSVAVQFVADGMLLTAFFVAGAIFLFRWLWLCSALMAASALLGALLPDAAQIIFEVLCTVVIGVAAAFMPKRPPPT